MNETFQKGDAVEYFAGTDTACQRMIGERGFVVSVMGNPKIHIKFVTVDFPTWPGFIAHPKNLRKI